MNDLNDVKFLIDHRINDQRAIGQAWGVDFSIQRLDVKFSGENRDHRNSAGFVVTIHNGEGQIFALHHGR